MMTAIQRFSKSKQRGARGPGHDVAEGEDELRAALEREAQAAGVEDDGGRPLQPTPHPARDLQRTIVPQLFLDR